MSRPVADSPRTTVWGILFGVMLIAILALNYYGYFSHAQVTL